MTNDANEGKRARSSMNDSSRISDISEKETRPSFSRTTETLQSCSTASGEETLIPGDHFKQGKRRTF